MKKKFLAGIAILGVTALMTSCSKMPQAEIDAANAAIELAREAGADLYVHESFVALQDSMKSVLVGIEAQSSKFFKNYSSGKESLLSVAQFAEEVQSKTEIRKEELKVEIQKTIAEVKSLVEANRSLILEAPKGKEGTAALVAIKGEVDAIEMSINSTSALFETGEYLTCLDQANSAKDKAVAINSELTEVIAKYKANVKGKKS